MKKIIFLTTIIVVLLLMNTSVYATDDELYEYKINDIQEYLDDNEIEMDAKEIVEKLISGKSKNVFKDIFLHCIKKDLKEIIFDKKMLVKIIVLSFVSSLLCNFTDMFNAKQLNDASFYVIYLMITGALFGGFFVAKGVAEGMVMMICDFLKILIPSFGMALCAGGNISAAMGTYEILFASLYLISYVYLNVLIPLISIYVVLCLVNNIFTEDILSKSGELIRFIIRWANRILIGAVISVNTVQSTLVNTLDSARVKGVYRLITLFPGVGSSAKTVAEVMVSSSSVIKNAIGVIGLCAIVTIAFVPVAKMLGFALMYKLSEAIIQPVADKRIIKSIDGAYEGVSLLMNVMFGVIIIFFVVIVVVCISTGMGV